MLHQNEHSFIKIRLKKSEKIILLRFDADLCVDVANLLPWKTLRGLTYEEVVNCLKQPEYRDLYKTYKQFHLPACHEEDEEWFLQQILIKEESST